MKYKPTGDSYCCYCRGVCVLEWTHGLTPEDHDGWHRACEKHRNMIDNGEILEEPVKMDLPRIDWSLYYGI